MNIFSKILLLGGVLSLTTPVMAADTYKLDPMHTAITWHINHFGFSNPSGKFMNVEGSLILDTKNPTESKVNVTIPLANVDSGIAKLDANLKSKEFFDVEKFPTATFVSDKVDITEKDTAIVQGTLTLHGVSKLVDLNVKLNKIGVNIFQTKTVGFSATTTIKRSDFGIISYLPGLADEVDIDIESEANHF